MIVAAMLLALMQQPAPPPPASDTAAGRPCVVEIDSVGGRGQQVEVRKGENNFFAGGGVLAHCRGTGSTLSADSVAWFAGVGRFDMIGQRNPVHIRDTAIALDATTASYFLHQDRLEAHRNVVAVNRNTGSVLRGPNLTYYRAAKGVRDTLEMYASGRPTIDYRSRADSGGGEPYVIVADRVRFKGNDRMWGGGQVTIDRSDFAARAVCTLNTIQADSLALDLPDEVLTEARAFGHAYSTSKKESPKRDSTTTPEVNWIAGDSLTARWAQVADSSGTPRTTLHRLVARGSARSFTHLASEHDSTGSSLNYSRGKVIDVVLKGDKIDRVTVTGQADGVQLEPRPPAPDSTKKADTTKTTTATKKKPRP